MTYFTDLHMHSTVSDGQYYPAELVRLAKQKGIQVMAITDHDAIAGFDEARLAGEKYGVTVLPGIEMSAAEYSTFHILGYCFDTKDKTLNERFSGLKACRQERELRIMDFLRAKGVDFPVSEVDELVSEGGTVGRPHFARVMLRRGICRTWKEVFDTYLDTEEFHKAVDFDKPKGRECVEWIKNAGGIVSLAHPYQTAINIDGLDALVRQMKDWGLDAIECWHFGHTKEMTAQYLELAKKYGLHATGGSDFHGEKIKPNIQLANLKLDLDWLLERD